MLLVLSDEFTLDPLPAAPAELPILDDAPTPPEAPAAPTEAGAAPPPDAPALPIDPTLINVSILGELKVKVYTIYD